MQKLYYTICSSDKCEEGLNPEICKHDLLISILSTDIAHNPLQRKACTNK